MTHRHLRHGALCRRGGSIVRGAFTWSAVMPPLVKSESTWDGQRLSQHQTLRMALALGFAWQAQRQIKGARRQIGRMRASAHRTRGFRQEEEGTRISAPSRTACSASFWSAWTCCITRSVSTRQRIAAA
eukprot:836518-Rhodomonas_salina.1